MMVLKFLPMPCAAPPLAMNDQNVSPSIYTSGCDVAAISSFATVVLPAPTGPESRMMDFTGSPQSPVSPKDDDVISHIGGGRAIREHERWQGARGSVGNKLRRRRPYMGQRQARQATERRRSMAGTHIGRADLKHQGPLPKQRPVGAPERSRRIVDV